MGELLFVVPNPNVYTRTCRSTACSAAVRGNGPALLAPSVSRTIIWGTKSSLEAGGVGWSDDEPISLGATRLSTSAIASKDRRIALPIAVRRAGVRYEIAFSNNF